MTTPSHPEPALTDGRHPGLSPADRARLTQAQAYEDAIAYRRARVAAPCPDCGPARCDDHATDLDLITWYQQKPPPHPGSRRLTWMPPPRA